MALRKVCESMKIGVGLMTSLLIDSKLLIEFSGWLVLSTKWYYKHLLIAVCSIYITLVFLKFQHKLSYLFDSFCKTVKIIYLKKMIDEILLDGKTGTEKSFHAITKKTWSFYEVTRTTDHWIRFDDLCHFFFFFFFLISAREITYLLALYLAIVSSPLRETL